MKIVVDTNVLISAFVFGGNAERTLEIALAQGEVFLSDFILDELERVLDHKFKIPTDKINRILSALQQVAFIQHPDNPLPDICRDPDDNHILRLSEFMEADFIVTGDKDLLSMTAFGTAQIVSPSAFLQML